MPPSIPPGATAVPVEDPAPEPQHEVAGGTADLDDERDATRESPAVPGPTAPTYEEPASVVPAPEASSPAPAPAREPASAPYDALLEASAAAEPAARSVPAATLAPVPTPPESPAPEQASPAPGTAPLAEREPEPVHDPAPAAPAEQPPAPFAEPADEGHGDPVVEAPVAGEPVVAAAPDDGAPAATSGEPAAPVAAEEEIPAPPVEHDRMDDVPAGFVDVVLALGANLGDAQQTLRDAITDLDRISGLEITEVSPLARTAAVGGPDQPDFLNTVLLARTRLSARDLLHACQAVEHAHGRVRDERWGPRTLDVDLIVYGTLTAVADDLELPHPRAHERAFVLEPWSQIDPDAVLPGLGGGPVAALAATAPDRGGIRWLALDWLTDAAPEPTGAVPLATEGSAAPPAPAPAAPVVVDDPYRQQPADAAPGPHGAPTSGPVGPQAVPEAVPVPAEPQHAPVPPQAPHQALPQRPPVPQEPSPAQPVPPQEPPAPGAALPVAPPQAAIPPQAAPAEGPVRPVFAPVSEGVAPAPEGSSPTVVPDGSFRAHDVAALPNLAPFPGPSNRPADLPTPEAPAQESVPSTEHVAPAFPAFAPVHPGEPEPAAAPPAQAPAPAPATDDGIIRSVPFAPVSAPAPASAPGPLADASLHPAPDPWPPFGPVAGAGRDDER
ncbi:2-amino-4-hydroxy-6-hydroxymethyldihydropteridine diphosphokinase [Cellulosimicrobium cellulans]|nr:2-amino-4-hydroxy-6-hydroxymethyldihydropteridine diphosphokinase [Cellulosimicrobium cellulans]